MAFLKITSVVFFFHSNCFFIIIIFFNWLYEFLVFLQLSEVLGKSKDSIWPPS